MHTGDLGVLDAAGYLHLRGRQSEMFIRGGYNVYPAEVEDLLATHPKVARAAVIGVPDPVFGEIGWAFVVAARPGGAADAGRAARRSSAPSWRASSAPTG